MRITAAVVLLVALELSGAGFVVYALETQRLERNVSEEVRQELTEFETFRTGTDNRFASPRQLIEAVLQRNTPAGSELLLALTEVQAPLFQSGVQLHEDLQGADLGSVEPAFLEAIADSDPDGESFRLDSARYGPVVVAVKAVRSTNDTPDSAFVVAYFVRTQRTELVDTCARTRSSPLCRCC